MSLGQQALRQAEALLGVLQRPQQPMLAGRQDGAQRLGVAERLLAERHLVEGLARRVPEQAPVIRAIARQCLEDAVAGFASSRLLKKGY